MKFVKLDSSIRDKKKPCTVKEGQFEHDDMKIGYTIIEISGEIPHDEPPKST